MAKTRKNSPCHAPVDHGHQLPRLRRIEGQIRGLQRMIEEQRYCLDVINQIGAITAALRRVQGDMLREHIAAVARAATAGHLSDRDLHRMANEVSLLLKRLA